MSVYQPFFLNHVSCAWLSPKISKKFAAKFKASLTEAREAAQIVAELEDLGILALIKVAVRSCSW